MSTELSLWIKKIFILIAILSLGYLLSMLQGLIVILIVSGFITILITPLVNILEEKKIHPSITVLGVYLTILIIGSIVAGTIIPIIIQYVTDTINSVISWANTAQGTYKSSGIQGFHLNPYIEESILFLFNTENIDKTLSFIRENAGNLQSIITNQLSTLTNGGFLILSSVGGAFFNWLLIAVMTFSMVLERKQIGKFILEIIPNNIEKYLVKHYIDIQKTLNSWIKAMLILSLSIFCITYISLTFVEIIFGFDTERTFTLALISGVMEFIPYIGPILSLIPALIIGLSISWKIALIITILYIIIQQFENNILVPYVMSRTLDLSPILVFIVMLIGATLGGILGIILAVPIAAICKVVYMSHKKEQGNIDIDILTNSPVVTKSKKVIEK